MMNFRHALVLIASLLVWAAGCATTGTRNVMSPSSPFTDDDGALFDDGVDMVGYPAGLSGRWADDWISGLRNRTERSDLIAELTVTTVRTDTSPEQRVTHWLVADVGDDLKGTYEGELGLASSSDELGFESVDRARTGLLEKQPLILFAKWVKDDAGTVRARWHLVRAGEDIAKAVRAQIDRTRGPQRQTIMH